MRFENKKKNKKGDATLFSPQLNHSFVMKDNFTNTIHTLKLTSSERDLGVIISHDLKEKKQVANVVSKANKWIGICKRTFVSRDISVWKKLYPTYIRSQLEFAVAVWNPHAKGDINALEKVQHRATKIPHSMKGLSYDKRCQSFGLMKLEDRRARGDLIEKYKIHTGLEIVNWQAPPLLATARAGRRAQLRREIVHHCTERHNFFNNRIVDLWNNIPNDVANSDNLNQFKKKIDEGRLYDSSRIKNRHR
jgi:hypothetical protein